VRVGNFIAVAGTAPIPGDSGRVDTWSVYEQTRLCLEIVRKAIQEAGGHLDNVIRTRIMLMDISNWREAAQAHGEYFSNIKPTCTFIGKRTRANSWWTCLSLCFLRRFRKR
jgi:enamine deaminase RidA (YjgF/YER057c/UK114 family)